MVNFYQKGQVLLVVVLVMVVVLTVGLSVAARTISTVRTSSEEDNSQRAFSAAEAGIEESLTTNLASSGVFDNNASYTTTVSELSGTDILMNNNGILKKDTAVDLWLSEYPAYVNPWSGNLTFYWGSDSDACTTSELTNTMAAIEVMMVAGSKAAPILTHYAWDPCVSRQGTNNFTSVGPSSGFVAGKNFGYRTSIAVTDGLLARIVPLYASTKIAVRGCDAAGSNCISLPSQGTVITSVGTADNTSRKIVSFRSYPSLPTELFPFVLFAPK